MKRVLLFICLLFTLTGCINQTNQAGEIKESKEETAELPTIKIGWQDAGYPAPFTFSTSGPGGFLRNSLLFDSLTWKDETGVIPWLAKEWSISEDELMYTFKLEEDVTFHDGQPLTAADIVFTYEYFTKHPFPWNADISYVRSVKEIDNHTVEFTLTTKYAPFITEVAGIIPILPKHIWETVENPLEFREEKALVGTGPFLLESYDENEGNYLYVPNQEFFKGNVNVKELQFLNVNNRILSLQNNEINAGMTFKYSDVTEMEKQGFDVIKSEPTGSAVRVVFNLEHSQLQNKELRQAIAYALNREDLAKKVTAGGEPLVGSAGVIPPDSPWYNDQIKTYSYDKEKAGQILDDLGYEMNSQGVREGLSLSVLVSSTSEEAQLMKEMLKDIGIELTIQQVDTATFTTAMGENNYDMAITSHIGLSGDPDFLRLWFSGEASNQHAARGKAFNHTEFQELAKNQIEILDDSERKKIIDQMQGILAEELPTLVLFHRPFYFIHDSKEFDGWFNTYEGIADGISLWENKEAFIDER